MQSGTLQSGYHHTVSFLSENSKIKMNNTPTARTADHNVTVFASFFRNSATRSAQMAEPNRALFRERFHTTQAQVQPVYVTVHTRICRQELHSGVGRAAC